MLRTRKAAVIGSPVSHSKSPMIHEYWMNQNGIEGQYEAIETPAAMLGQTVKRLAEQEYVGFNVTVPHKKDIMDMCRKVDSTASAIGAVNTVVFNNEQMEGYNTDSWGFIDNIKANAPRDFSFKNGPAVVLGAGGAAHAVVYGLKMEGVREITIVNRTPVHAEGLARKFSANAASWFDVPYLLKEANMVVNASSLGMEGMPEMEIDLHPLPQNALVNDLVYAPLMTDFLQQAKSRGNTIVTGIGMLLHQAAPAFEHWFGIRPKVTDGLVKMVTK